MFAELVTEAGPVRLPRAEAVAADREHHYTFTWPHLPHNLSADTLVFVRIYVSREGGSCIGMVSMAREHHEAVIQGNGLTLGPMRIYIPFGREVNQGVSLHKEKEKCPRCGHVWAK